MKHINRSLSYLLLISSLLGGDWVLAEEIFPENTWLVPVSEMIADPKEKQPLTEAQRRAILMASLEDRRGGTYRRTSMTSTSDSSIAKGLSADILSSGHGVRPMGSISMPRKMNDVEASGVSPISASFIYQPMGDEGPQNSGISPNIDIPSEYAYGDGFSFLLSPEAGGMDPKDYPKDPTEDPEIPVIPSQRESSLPRGTFRPITQSGFESVPAGQLYIVRESELETGNSHLMSWEGIGADVIRYERHLFWSQVGSVLLEFIKTVFVLVFLVSGIYYFRRDIATLLLSGRIYLRFR